MSSDEYIAIGVFLIALGGALLLAGQILISYLMK